MAKVESTTITTTAACDTGRRGSCRGVVFSLTDAHLTDCQHGCHAPEPIEDDELDDLLAEDADRRLGSSHPNGSAGHYLGTIMDLDRRLATHREGKGARILAAANERGIAYDVVRTWPVAAMSSGG